MKINLKIKQVVLLSLVVSSIFTSCKNQEWEFADYPYQTVYFAYQGPVRTITLGEDIFDTSLDNDYKCQIMATTGGVYTTKGDVTIGIAVDNSLSTGKAFSTGGDIITMPANYYTLASDKIVITKGNITGGVEVQLTDAFFADPLAIKNTYVIPLRMTSVVNADSLLAAKDYVLYAIKYINPWHGNYLRRGKDVITGKNGNTALNQTIVRHKAFVEKDDISTLSTQSLSGTRFPIVFKGSGGQNITRTLLLTINNAGDCTVSAATTDFTATGSGKFVKKGEKNSWGNQDRDALYLNYEVDMNEMHVSSTDTLVIRDRGVKMETFNAVTK
ncbi:DUF5627 domain-containing protein [Arcticibacter eurypsychrophilus]|uniref:DUF5627 domain-containing protein n=1 Tax=Arcticibacter eurypsychrophilus TaxID=1434752 RepID=UPI000B1514A4|nr:DUF5627 domain-containing protein [Arcticibacter eurypsychrophilus]